MTDEELYKHWRKIAIYYCKLFNRMELADDITQDLAEAELKGCHNNKILSMRAISALCSKVYNQQYIHNKRPWAFVSIQQCRLVYDPYSEIDSRIYIEQLLASLSLIRRRYLDLWLNGYTQQEIAQIYHRSRRVVAKTIKRAINQLRGDNYDIRDLR